MDLKRPKHCKGCTAWNRAGHKEGSRLHKSKHQNWCCKYSTQAPKAASICIQQNGKTRGEE